MNKTVFILHSFEGNPDVQNSDIFEAYGSVLAAQMTVMEKYGYNPAEKDHRALFNWEPVSDKGEGPYILKCAPFQNRIFMLYERKIIT